MIRLTFKFPFLFGLFPLLGGIGFFLRLAQLRFGFESGSGLALQTFLPGRLLPLLCLLLIAAALAAAAAYAPGARRASPQHRASLLVCTAAAVLTAAMGLLLLPSGGGMGTMGRLLGAAALLTALYQVLLPHAGAALQRLCCMENTVFYLVWLIVVFARHASDPVTAAFWPPLLALCAACCALCRLSAASCGQSAPRLQLFLLLLGGSLCLIAAADGLRGSGALYALFGFAGAAALQFCCAHAMLRA